MQGLGHDGPPTMFWTENLLTDVPLTECPLRTLLKARETSPALMNELDRYRDTYAPAYAAGHLLVTGGIADQPARYLDLIHLMRETEDTMQEKHEAIVARNREEAE